MPTIKQIRNALTARASLLSALLILTLAWTNTFLHDLANGGLLSDTFVECERSIENVVGSIPCRVSPHFHSPMVEPSAEDNSNPAAVLQAIALFVTAQIFSATFAFRIIVARCLFKEHLKILRATPPLYILNRALLI